MKKHLKRLLIVACIISVFCVAAYKIYFLKTTPKGQIPIRDSKIENTEDIKLVAHRGLCSLAPENTIPAFEEAVKHNYYAAECDIFLTTDGEWVVIHNNSLWLTTNGYGKISEKIFDDVSESRVNRGAGIREYGKQPIPTLRQYLEICKKGNIVPQIEIKSRTNNGLKELTKIIESFDLADKAIIITFDKEQLLYLKSIAPNMEYWYLCHEITDEDISFCKENNFGIGFNVTKNTDYSIKKAVSELETVGAWTVDDIETLKYLYSLGVKYITTNKIIP